VSDRYVLWAFEGTLATRHDGWGGALRDALRRSDVGQSASVAALADALAGRFPWDRPDEMHPDWPGDRWWREHQDAFAAAFADCGVPRRRADAVAERVREAYLDPAAWERFDDAGPALEALDDRGWRHAVYWNGPPELADLLDALDLADHVEFAFTSATTGYELPHPRAYETVERDLPDCRLWTVAAGADAVQGARRVGIPGVLVRDESPAVDRCLPDLTGLADLLG
jgi:putative hydrolase of the HAD superfamily